MNAARTDIHRPSAPEFDPEAYDLLGVFDLSDESDSGERQAAVAAALAAGAQFTSVHDAGQCGHCGVYLRYAALMEHRPTHGLLYVGETCLANRFEALTKSEFARLRKTAAHRGAAKRRQAAVAALVEQFPELAELLDQDSTITWGGGDFLPSISRRLTERGELTDRQIEAAVSAIRRGRERAERSAAPAATTGAAHLPALPTGRMTVTGVIARTAWRDSAFGDGRTVLIVTVGGALTGWTVEVTLPRALMPVTSIGALEALPGRQVSFDVAVKAGGRSGYAFGSRPTRAKFLAE
jgi:hypothetical protein